MSAGIDGCLPVLCDVLCVLVVWGMSAGIGGCVHVCWYCGGVYWYCGVLAGGAAAAHVSVEGEGDEFHQANPIATLSTLGALSIQHSSRMLGLAG